MFWAQPQPFPQPQPLPALGPGTQAPNLAPGLAQATPQNPNPLVTGPMPGFLSQWAANPYQFNDPVWQGLPSAPIQMPAWFQGQSPYSQQNLPTAPVPDAAAVYQQPQQPPQPPQPPQPAPPALPEAPVQGKPLYFGQGTQQMYRNPSSAFHAEVHNRSRPDPGMDGSNIGFRSSGPPQITRIAQPASWLDRYRAAR